ncbi:hypothetical protein NHX12_004987 [Muraenolepis orangiensis]|uniref:Uncharacterized protein n=1 Tax=Muraenolepis orangiensis TaxID=630683 RepID=A0A9Q0DTR5_9TELE|nr:hypothetical protein NHX12_004987 [Muraenolepis orangiensis]
MGRSQATCSPSPPLEMTIRPGETPPHRSAHSINQRKHTARHYNAYQSKSDHRGPDSEETTEGQMQRRGGAPLSSDRGARLADWAQEEKLPPPAYQTAAYRRGGGM